MISGWTGPKMFAEVSVNGATAISNGANALVGIAIMCSMSWKSWNDDGLITCLNQLTMFYNGLGHSVPLRLD